MVYNLAQCTLVWDVKWLRLLYSSSLHFFIYNRMTATTSINFQTKMKKKSDHTKTVFFFPPSGGVENMILFIY